MGTLLISSVLMNYSVDTPVTEDKTKASGGGTRCLGHTDGKQCVSVCFECVCYVCWHVSVGIQMSSVCLGVWAPWHHSEFVLPVGISSCSCCVGTSVFECASVCLCKPL